MIVGEEEIEMREREKTESSGGREIGRPKCEELKQRETERFWLKGEEDRRLIFHKESPTKLRVRFPAIHPVTRSTRFSGGFTVKIPKIGKPSYVLVIYACWLLGSCD
jgi:hypothetical protein